MCRLPDCGRTGYDSVRARVVHTAINENWPSTFSCSNGLLNHVQHMIYWTQTGNINGYPMDCPQRDERQGWAGDGHLTAEEAMYNFNMASLYTKWIDDIFFDQRRTASFTILLRMKPATGCRMTTRHGTPTAFLCRGTCT